MISYVREGTNTYNGVTDPPYNVISYTWGNFTDSTATAITIKGVDWPIPGVKRDHFTKDAFKNAIQRVAGGIQHRCEWVWVDIACIPQRHDQETQEARDMRGQEIGRQVEIFRRAREAFAWLSHLKQADVWASNDQSSSTIDDFIHQANQGVSVRDAGAAAHYLRACDSRLCRLETWMNKFLADPWLSSLWTLQEMVLRPDAYIVLDDDFMDPYYRDWSMASNNRPWTFVGVKNDIFHLQFSLRSHVTKHLKNAEAMLLKADSGANTVQQQLVSASAMILRIKKLVDVQNDKGLDFLGIEVPNAAYSAAQHRNVREVTDRIYGIVQTYEISCNPDPPGDCEAAKLMALEDEFGMKLVKKSALLSQLFIHSSTTPPRRSWLITQRCRIHSRWTSLFFPNCIVNQLGSLQVLERTKNARFKGNAWDLSSFAQSNAKYLFQLNPRSPDTYQGLLLDHHVSKNILGQVVEYIDGRESMLDVVKTLNVHYNSGIVKVALLGSSSSPKLPAVDYVGLVLAPYETIDDEVLWMRIGLIEWTEHYSENKLTPHYYFPPFHHLRCTIV